MAKNLVSNGHTINITAGGTITKGDVDDIGDLIGVALNSAVSGETVVYALSGVWDIPRAAAEVYVVGEEVGVTSNEVVKAGTGSYAMESASAAAGVLAVMINGNPGS